MEIFKKKKLFCFLFLFFAFIPFFNVNALDVTLKDNTVVSIPDFPDDGNDGHIVFINTNGYYHLYTFDKTIKTPGIIPLDSSKKFYPYFRGTGVHNWYYASSTATEWGVNKLNDSCTGSCLFPTSDQTYTKIIYSDIDVISWSWGGSYKTGTDFVNANFDLTTFSEGDIVYYADTIPTIVLEEKKSFSYNDSDMTNPMRYIDLYFDKEDMGNEINFELKIEDYFDYFSCSYCEYLDIEKFEFSYLVKDENGLYKWVDIPNTETGLYFDYDGETFPRNEDGIGLILTGRINLAYDTSLYEFERIRASIKISNGYNFKYTYSDDSNISDGNIDEYYHYMMYNYGESRLNRIEGGSTKYIILTTTQEELNGKLVVQYINTDKWLYAEYFDTFNHTYLDNSGLYQEHYLFGGKDLGISEFIIGKNNNRGLYLMNYLYQKNDKNLNSKYYFYIPTEVSYSTTDYLDEAIYYDNDGNLNTTITANPNYETDNLNFIDNFRGIFNFLNDLQTTSDTFNYMWNSFYNTMPIMVQAFLKFMTHILCILMFMKIVGYD